MLTGPRQGVHYPGDLTTVRAWFPTDAACVDYLDWLRWPDGFYCPHCGAGKSWRLPDGRHRCAGCDRRVSVTSGTIFDKTRTPLTVWFEAAWLVTASKPGLAATTLARVTGMGSYQTAWAMLGRFRQVMVVPDREPLSGVVEVDETFVGGKNKPGKPGRGAAGKVLVAGAVERGRGGRGFGRARLAVIGNAKSPTLQAFLEANVAPGSTVVTDGLLSYTRAVPAAGMVHEPVNVRTSGLHAHELLPGVHRLFSLVKRWLAGTHQGAVDPTHLQEYLDEFVFRFNRRSARARGLLFLRLLERAVAADPVTYRDLVRIGAPKPVHPTPPATRGKPATLAPPPLTHPWRQQAT